MLGSYFAGDPALETLGPTEPKAVFVIVRYLVSADVLAWTASVVGKVSAPETRIVWILVLCSTLSVTVGF